MSTFFDMTKPHSFHIPVMGIGYTLETPLKVSALGIDSVISLVDDILLEKLRKFYCNKFEIPYQEISDKIDDFRAKRITSYLNLINALAKEKYEALRQVTDTKQEELKKYLQLLADNSTLKKDFQRFMSENPSIAKMADWIKQNLPMGSIDVNIMTKVDKVNYKKDEKLPTIYNDAHAALRGFANSDLESSLILSAGMNPRLYGYLEEFSDFCPNEHGQLKKKIILKVSDYRSALIQGKFLAKKGIWVSEFRIESGLNCGGHAFATDGHLLGPVLASFRDHREELTNSIHEVLCQALARKNSPVPDSPLPLRITAQGGVGTNEEHNFLLEEYKLDSVGWGTPFLLVPEATTVDEETLEKLARAKEDDLYLSGISPLGVPFNTLKGNTKDEEKQRLIDKGRPGSSCPKKFVSLNHELTEKGICTASRQYQDLRIKALDLAELSAEEYKTEYDKIIEKSCICVGLGTSILLANDIDTRVEGEGVSICPGPNMAYFSKKMSLKDMIDHIYGRANVITRHDRPNLFIKELTIYLNYLKNQLEETSADLSMKQQKYFSTFITNLFEGIEYYKDLFREKTDGHLMNQLDKARLFLKRMEDKILTFHTM